MDKQLNIEALKQAAELKGYTQTALAEELNLTKAAVSKWFNGLSFPRPAELLKLGKLLGLKYKQLTVECRPQSEPIVAFRKRAATKTTLSHINRAKNMGRFLEPLVEYLDFDKFVAPQTLKNPSLDYKYIQELILKVRNDLHIDLSKPVDFHDLIGIFHDYQAVIIPTLWGEKVRHENALHIYLPKSQTTWVYLNLDTNIHDFKFWMAHELGHVMSVSLLTEGNMELAEDFADTFAGAFLFPSVCASATYREYSASSNDTARIKVLKKAAEDFVISPLSVYKEIEKYAAATGQPFSEVAERSLHAFISRFNQSYKNVSQGMFDESLPDAQVFMDKVTEVFATDIFVALRKYIQEKQANSNALSNILNVSPMDAKAYHEALSQ